MTANEYFVLKTQINQKWFWVITLLLGAIVLYPGEPDGCVDKFKAIMGFLALIGCMLAGIAAIITIINIIRKNEKIDNLYQQKVNFEDAAKELNYLPKRNEQ